MINDIERFDFMNEIEKEKYYRKEYEEWKELGLAVTEALSEVKNDIKEDYLKLLDNVE